MLGSNINQSKTNAIFVQHKLQGFFYHGRHCNVQVVHPNSVQTDSYRSAASLSAFLNKCLPKYNSIDERSFAN